jgi:signal transduction histidine kinase
MGWLRDRLARLGVRGPTGRDTVAAAVLAVLGLARPVVALAVNGGRLPVPGWQLAAANLAATADVGTIALRRRVPRTALALATAVVVAAAALPVRYAMTGLGVLVCAYTVATLLPWRRAATTLGACAVAHAAGGALVTAAGGELRLLLTFWGVDGHDLVDVVLATAASYGIPGLLGAYVQTRRAYTAELVARAERLEREQHERAELAVASERGRIARELHDIAAHDLSAIVVQAGAADRLVDRDAGAAKAALASIRRQGRETLTALRQLVGVVRDSDEAGRRVPQPTLARLDELVAGAREGGVPVETTWSGAGRPLPPAVDLAAYRIVQEALTNARRHAPGAAVSVAVAVDDTGVRVVVANGPLAKGVESASGRPSTDSDRQDRRSGHGLAGMRERVQLTGGTFTAGSTGEGGWRVEAHLPAPPAPDGPP